MLLPSFFPLERVTVITQIIKLLLQHVLPLLLLMRGSVSSAELKTSAALRRSLIRGWIWSSKRVLWSWSRCLTLKETAREGVGSNAGSEELGGKIKRKEEKKQKKKERKTAVVIIVSATERESETLACCFLPGHSSREREYTRPCTSHFVLYVRSASRAGVAQWLKRRIHGRKSADSSPGRSGGIIFIYAVNFLRWLSGRYPFHPLCYRSSTQKIQVILPKVQVAGYN